MGSEQGFSWQRGELTEASGAAQYAAQPARHNTARHGTQQVLLATPRHRRVVHAHLRHPLRLPLSLVIQTCASAPHQPSSAAHRLPAAAAGRLLQLRRLRSLASVGRARLLQGPRAAAAHAKKQSDVSGMKFVRASKHGGTACFMHSGYMGVQACQQCRHADR